MWTIDANISFNRNEISGLNAVSSPMWYGNGKYVFGEKRVPDWHLMDMLKMGFITEAEVRSRSILCNRECFEG